MVSNINILLKIDVIKEKGRRVERNKMKAQNRKREEKGREESERVN